MNIVENPLDNSKLLIGFETGLIVVWNMKNKKADHRLNANIECNLLSTSWYYDGKQIIASYENGFISTCNLKSESKPNIIRPHCKLGDLLRTQFENVQTIKNFLLLRRCHQLGKGVQ
jgi:syntaxin-binding protein 5